MNLARRVAVILAAGLGKRMKSDRVKVLHPVAGVPMLGHVVNRVRSCGVDRCIVVVGHQADRVREFLGDQVEYAEQREQLGTGHAVQQAVPKVDPADELLVLCGDTPLLTEQEIETLFQKVERERLAAALLSTELENPTGYGRIIRGSSGEFIRIVEEADANHDERACREINAGIYCFRAEPLIRELAALQPVNAQGEYYLVDVLTGMVRAGDQVGVVQTDHPEHVLGVNNRRQLAEAEAVMRRRIRDHWLDEGVSMIAPETVWIDADVRIGRDTVLYPNTYLCAGSVIGRDCHIGPGSEIIASNVGDRVKIWRSVVEESHLEDEAQVGPFAHLRPGNHLRRGVKVGNFAELKNARIGEGSKIPHHSYLGDVRVGESVNIGAGVVTVNYDGLEKHHTEIDDHAFVGCNANLIAPVKIGEGGYVAAGSTINRDVPGGDLAIARARQENKSGWAKRLLRKKSGINGHQQKG